MNILELLEYEEGYREKAYHCSERYPTIGIGQKIGPKNAPLNFYTFTVSKELAYTWLNETVQKLEGQLSTSKATMLAWDNCNNARRSILISMAYQMGFDGLRKFKKMIAALERGDFDTASKESLDSRWAKQHRSAPTGTLQLLNRHLGGLSMNPKSLAMIFKIIPNIKQWVFADGKFQPKRAMWLFLFMCALGGMAYLIGPEQTAEVVDMLDDVSDIVGYVE